jgi:hypothetical protein
MIRTASLSLATAALLAATPALAQEENKPPLIVSFGGGVQAEPQFHGSEEYKLSPLFTGFVRRQGDPIPFRTPDDGISPTLVPRRPVEFGHTGPFPDASATRRVSGTLARLLRLHRRARVGFVNLNFGISGSAPRLCTEIGGA